jgi:hypothetical protein
LKISFKPKKAHGKRKFKELEKYKLRKIRCPEKKTTRLISQVVTNIKTQRKTTYDAD